MKIQSSLIAIALGIFTVAIVSTCSVFAQPSQGENQNKQAQAYYDSASTKYKLGDKKGALLELDNAIRIDPKYAKAYFNRGVIKSALGYLSIQFDRKSNLLTIDLLLIDAIM